MERLTMNEAKSQLCQFLPFNAGNLTGVYLSDTLGMYTGEYAVYSYGVEIARLDRLTGIGTISASAYSHSKTTSRHANLVAAAWNLGI